MVILTTGAVGAVAYTAKKLFDPVLSSIGEDINKLYTKRRDNIVLAATKKVIDPNDGNQVNLRVARDVLWSGAVTEGEVCAEYFGGLLAAARSVDGQDDGAIQYVDTVKAMSSKQLELHYIIYSAFQKLLKKEIKMVNVGQESDVRGLYIYLHAQELLERDIHYSRELHVLARLGLVSGFKYDYIYKDNQPFGYVQVSMSSYGVLLFAAAHNKLDSWLGFSQDSYESTEGIQPIKLFFNKLEALEESLDALSSL